MKEEHRSQEVEDRQEVNEETEGQEASIVVEEAMIPIKNPEVTIRDEMEEDGTYMLFNAENELVLVINQTGKFILERCSGEKTVGEIFKDIENNFKLEGDIDLLSIVKEFLSTMLKAKLINMKEEEK